LAELKEEALIAQRDADRARIAREEREERRAHTAAVTDLALRVYESRDSIARNLAEATSLAGDTQSFLKNYGEFKRIFTPFTPEQLAVEYSKALQAGAGLETLTGMLDVNQTRLVATSMQIPEERVNAIVDLLDENGNNVAKAWRDLREDIMDRVEAGTLSVEEAQAVLQQDSALLTAEASRPSRGIERIPTLPMPETLKDSEGVSLANILPLFSAIQKDAPTLLQSRYPTVFNQR
jgi:hypothetical protein